MTTAGVTLDRTPEPAVRIPAAYNGVYGLIPTHGAISSVGLVVLSDRFDSIGPLARSLEGGQHQPVDYSVLTKQP